MSTPAALILQWRDGALQALEDCDLEPAVLLAADSWLTLDGRTRALELHRQRFADAVAEQVGADAPFPAELDAFWGAVVDAIPAEGRVFPRVELLNPIAPGAAPMLRARMRPAPEERVSLVLATHHGDDPRTRPELKGPDLDAMIRLRTAAQGAGADEAVLLVDGQVVEGSTSALLWWNGDTLVAVPDWMPRVASVTERSIRVLAGALGTEVVEYLATPDELDHKEIWAVNALHGIRLVTGWNDGPAPAAVPGRRELWQRRLDALRRPAS